jgi:hypothetical protein
MRFDERLHDAASGFMPARMLTFARPRKYTRGTASSPPQRTMGFLRFARQALRSSRSARQDVRSAAPGEVAHARAIA